MGIVDSTPFGDDTIDDNVDIIHERPPTKMVEKERERKRKKAIEDLDSRFHDALSRMRDDKTTCMMERREVIIKADKKRRKNNIEKMKSDREIMKLDLSNMNAL